MLLLYISKYNNNQFAICYTFFVIYIYIYKYNNNQFPIQMCLA